MNGPYSIENLILDRLAERLGSLAIVASGAALSAQSISLGELAVPLVVVEPSETDVSNQSAKADHIIEAQTWIVAVVVRHVADPDRLRADYTELDSILIAAIGALTGWKPPIPGSRELRYTARTDVVHETGLLEVGLVFTTFYNFTAPSA